MYKFSSLNSLVINGKRRLSQGGLLILICVVVGSCGKAKVDLVGTWIFEGYALVENGRMTERISVEQIIQIQKMVKFNKKGDRKDKGRQVTDLELLAAAGFFQVERDSSSFFAFKSDGTAVSRLDGSSWAQKRCRWEAKDGKFLGITREVGLSKYRREEHEDFTFLRQEDVLLLKRIGDRSEWLVYRRES